MSRKDKIRDQQKLYFVSFATVNWIDVFIRREYKDIVVASFSYCIQQKCLEVYAWCMMSSHVNLIIGSMEAKMEDILRNLMLHTSKALLKAIAEHNQESRKEWMLWMFERASKQNPNNAKHPFWQQHNQPIELWSHTRMDQKLHYLHRNSVEAGWVEEPEHSSTAAPATTPGQRGWWK
jgi:putative transposase